MPRDVISTHLSGVRHLTLSLRIFYFERFWASCQMRLGYVMDSPFPFFFCDNPTVTCWVLSGTHSLRICSPRWRCRWSLLAKTKPIEWPCAAEGGASGRAWGWCRPRTDPRIYPEGTIEADMNGISFTKWPHIQVQWISDTRSRESCELEIWIRFNFGRRGYITISIFIMR